MSRIESCANTAKQQIQINDLYQKSAQILIMNWAAQQLQMASHKSMEKNLRDNAKSMVTNFAAKTVANEKQSLKAIDCTSFRFQLKESIKMFWAIGYSK